MTKRFPVKDAAIYCGLNVSTLNKYRVTVSVRWRWSAVTWLDDLSIHLRIGGHLNKRDLDEKGRVSSLDD